MEERANKENVIATLNDLIAICRDGEEGYMKAAEAIDDEKYVSLFTMYAEQRRQFVVELQDAVRRLGGEPVEDDDLIAAVHRRWIDLKSSITDGDTGAIISEVERGEDEAVDTYQTAMQEELPDRIFSMIDEQYRAIKAAHDNILGLETATR